MPRSILLGRPWPEPGEPLWQRDDYEYALAWQAELDAQCSGCGGDLGETSGEDAITRFEGAAVTCWRCAAAEDYADRLREDGKPLAGVKVYTRERG